MAYVMLISMLTLQGIQFGTAATAALICAVISEAAPVFDDRRVRSDDLRQTLLTPPSTTMSEPVMNELSSEARKRAALASSSGCASLSMGV